jgi:protease I
MAQQPLKGLKIAILVTDGFEQVEMTEPRKALDEAGAKTQLISPKEVRVRGWDFTDWGREFDVDVPLNEAKPQDYDALVLPGGVLNPDQLRMNENAVAFVKTFFDEHKPVASICHGPWTVIETGEARGRKMTSWPSLKTDLKNAGAAWVDMETVNDKHLLTSRKPDDIPAFNNAMIKMFDEECARPHVGSSAAQTAAQRPQPSA